VFGDERQRDRAAEGLCDARQAHVLGRDDPSLAYNIADTGGPKRRLPAGLHDHGDPGRSVAARGQVEHRAPKLSVGRASRSRRCRLGDDRPQRKHEGKRERCAKQSRDYGLTGRGWTDRREGTQGLEHTGDFVRLYEK
jgi:hypothetical protein